MKRIMTILALTGLAASFSAAMTIKDFQKSDSGITIQLTESAVNNYAVTGASLMLDDKPARNASGVGVSVADSTATITLMFPATADSLYNSLRVKTASGNIDISLNR